MGCGHGLNNKQCSCLLHFGITVEKVYTVSARLLFFPHQDNTVCSKNNMLYKAEFSVKYSLQTQFSLIYDIPLLLPPPPKSTITYLQSPITE